jgi:hypothetical protein
MSNTTGGFIKKKQDLLTIHVHMSPFLFFFISFVLLIFLVFCVYVFPMLPMSLDYQLLMALLAFSGIYLFSKLILQIIIETIY